MLNCDGENIEKGTWMNLTKQSVCVRSRSMEELEKLFGGWLAGSVQVKMNNLRNTKKSMWHL